ncbi:MAG: M20/M25/M40 family metallo-hydrolase [Chitinivibrionia bacterium]|nr:M20/M25/M40 family metallo-hydrolase [Chitinivibrionia bacterium]
MLDISRTLVDLTSDLVAINSVIGNEKEIADALFGVFAEYEIATQRVKNSLVSRLDFGKEKTIALIGHLDTVPKSREEQTRAKIENGNLIGLGTCDMKCGIACALKILYEIKKEIIFPSQNIVFVFYDGEEGPLPNGITRLLAENKLQNIDFAYILEPTCSKYSIGCLGALTAKLEICGISAHSANPILGKNALSEAAKIIKKIEETDKKIRKPQKIDGLSFYETINVTQLTTENASNVIPSKANLTINFRFSPKRTLENAKEFLFSIIDKNLIKTLDCANSCFVSADKTDVFLRNFCEKEIMQAWTDIAQLNAAQIPAINFGAGDIKLAHKPEEFVNIANLQNFYELLKKHV